MEFIENNSTALSPYFCPICRLEQDSAAYLHLPPIARTTLGRKFDCKSSFSAVHRSRVFRTTLPTPFLPKIEKMGGNL